MLWLQDCQLVPKPMARVLTFVCRIHNQLADHGLNNTNIAIEHAANESTNESNPEAGGKSDNQQRSDGAKTAQQEDGLATNSIAQSAPIHASACLSEREGGNEDARKERGL